MVLKTTGDMVQAPDIFARSRAQAKSPAATPAVTPEGKRVALSRSEAGARFRARFRVQRSFTKGDHPMFRQHLSKHLPKNVQRFTPPALLGDEAPKPKKRARAKKSAGTAAKKKSAKRARK